MELSRKSKTASSPIARTPLGMVSYSDFSHSRLCATACLVLHPRPEEFSLGVVAEFIPGVACNYDSSSSADGESGQRTRGVVRYSLRDFGRDIHRDGGHYTFSYIL